jgi:hypothetical protein
MGDHNNVNKAATRTQSQAAGRWRSGGVQSRVRCGTMTTVYDSEEEAYARRHELWAERKRREQDTPATAVPPVDRYMFDLQGFFVVRVRKAPMLPACMPRHSVRCAGRL